MAHSSASPTPRRSLLNHRCLRRSGLHRLAVGFQHQYTQTSGQGCETYTDGPGVVAEGASVGCADTVALDGVPEWCRAVGGDCGQIQAKNSRETNDFWDLINRRETYDGHALAGQMEFAEQGSGYRLLARSRGTRTSYIKIDTNLTPISNGSQQRESNEYLRRCRRGSRGTRSGSTGQPRSTAYRYRSCR